MPVLQLCPLVAGSSKVKLTSAWALQGDEHQLLQCACLEATILILFMSLKVHLESAVETGKAPTLKYSLTTTGKSSLRDLEGEVLFPCLTETLPPAMPSGV